MERPDFKFYNFNTERFDEMVKFIDFQQSEINRLKEENAEMIEMIDSHQSAINQFFDKIRNQNKQQ